MAKKKPVTPSSKKGITPSSPIFDEPGFNEKIATPDPSGMAIVPDDAGRVPASTAMKVDFPAPFGPISPVIRPGMTSIDTPSTACMPSK